MLISQYLGFFFFFFLDIIIYLIFGLTVVVRRHPLKFQFIKIFGGFHYMACQGQCSVSTCNKVYNAVIYCVK